MLNKNQSKKRNSWKYYAVIPALIAFVLVFQVEVIAKERQQEVKETLGEIKSVDVYAIKKTATDSELKEIKEKLKSLHNVDFEASEIKRNAANELTSLKIDVKYNNQVTQSIQKQNNAAIEDFAVVVTTEKDGNKKVGIQTAETRNTNPKIVKSKKLTTKTETNVNTNSNASTKTNSNTNTNVSTIVITSDDDNKSTTKVVTVNGKTNTAVSTSTKTKVKISTPLIIVDGEEMPEDFDIKDIDNKNIKSVNIYKGVDAIAKYGDKGASDVIEIEIRK